MCKDIATKYLFFQGCSLPRYEIVFNREFSMDPVKIDKHCVPILIDAVTTAPYKVKG